MPGAGSERARAAADIRTWTQCPSADNEYVVEADRAMSIMMEGKCGLDRFYCRSRLEHVLEAACDVRFPTSEL